jgi:hypothetical protein
MTFRLRRSELEKTGGQAAAGCILVDLDLIA